MAEIIKMDYGAMAELVSTLSQINQTLENLARAEGQIAQTLEQGALLGDAGAAFAEAIRGPLVKSTNKLNQKIEEEISDCRKAEQIMKQHDQEAAGKF